MILQRIFKSFPVTVSIKFFLVPALMVLVAFETFGVSKAGTTAIAGYDNSNIENTSISAENFNSELPSGVEQAVLMDVSEQNQISLNRLSITKANKELWSNGCLELEQPGEFCTQAIVPGWRVFVTGNDQTWIYHTDEQGRSLRVKQQ